ncbi:MAG TPA: transporter substrate-binding domain-containing protein [Burkholderiaceae bacterium]|jgi:polar amino acid transport system substrate-binding protein
MRVGWDEFPPYVFSGQDGEPVGLDVEMARSIFKAAGCRIEFVQGLPAKRQSAYMKSGDMDMQLGASEVRERHVYAWYSLPYRREIVALFARPGETAQYSVKQLSDLSRHNWQILSPYEGWYGQALADLQPQLEARHLLYSYVGSSQGLAMLYHKRADLLVGDLYTFFYTAKHEGLPVPEPLSVLVNDNQVHLIFSKRTVTRSDVAVIDAAIDKLDASGELRRIADRYALTSNLGIRLKRQGDGGGTGK